MCIRLCLLYVIKGRILLQASFLTKISPSTFRLLASRVLVQKPIGFGLCSFKKVELTLGYLNCLLELHFQVSHFSTWNVLLGAVTVKCRLGFIKLFEVQISFKPQLGFQKRISTQSFATYKRAIKKGIQRNPLPVKKFNFKWKGMNEAYFLLELWACMEFQICMEFRIQSGSVVKIEVLCMQF